MKRNSCPVLRSKTVKLIRVLPATGTMTRWIPLRPSSSSSIRPENPPAGHTTIASPPSSAITRATLTPPPPGSYFSLDVRTLWVGRTRSVSLETSMVGLSVSVAMVIDGKSPKVSLD